MSDSAVSLAELLAVYQPMNQSRAQSNAQGRSEDYPFRGVQDNFLPTKGRG
jgi:hypothetical protein